MRIRIRIEKNVALLAGKDVYGNVIVNVPAAELTEIQRETLIKYSHLPNYETLCDYGIDYMRNDISEAIKDVNEGSIDSVKKILDRLIEIDKEDKLKKDRLIKEEKEKDEKEVAEFLASQKENPELAIEDKYEEFKPVYILRQSITNPELEKVVNWAEAECERRNIERKTKNQEELTASLKADRLLKETGEKTLLRWAETFGSPLLKARISEEYEWLNLAEIEYAKSVIKHLGKEAFDYSEEADSCVSSERTTPTLDEIKAIKIVREKLNDEPAEAQLLWWVYKFEDGSVVKQTEINVTVTCPTGREIEHYFDIEKKQD
jgi:hypothetical protein